VATRVEAATLAPPRTMGERLARVLRRSPVHIGLILIAVIWLVPTIGLAVTSIRPRSDILASGWWHVFTSHLTFENYGKVIHTAGMGHAFLNSVYITLPATILPLALGALAAYAFAWTRFPFRDTVFLLIVALMVVPIQTAFVPLLKLFRNWDVDINLFDVGLIHWAHLNNSYWGIWLAHTAFGLPLAIFLFRNFFITLPKDLIEAARIDGASEFAVFRRVVLPLSVPALASFGIFQFLWVWNDLLMALVFVSDPSKQPMTVKITQLLSTYGVEYHLLSAAAFLLMLLPLVVFFALQRYFVQGLLAGSVKS
jgi:alpha-glucoside transport system permease protein